MIETVRLENYKNHADTTLHLGRLTCLVGPNSVGKSNMLEAIQRMSDVAQGKRHDFLQSLKNSLDYEWQSDSTPVLRQGSESLSVELVGIEPKAWTFSIEASKPDESEDSERSRRRYKFGFDWRWGDNSGGSPIDSHSRVNDESILIPEKLTDLLNSVRYFKLHGRALQAPSAPEELPPQLEEDGANLASVVRRLMTEKPNDFLALLKSLKEVVQTVKGVRTSETKVKRLERRVINVEGKGIPYDEEREERADELLFDMIGAEGVPAHAVSEGTLIATGLLAALVGTGDDGPALLMIDDLEQGLHPKAQRDLVAVLRRLLDAKPDLQILFTTHSPYVVDELDAEEVYVLDTDAEGVAHAKRLSAHPDAERGLQVLSTGEFWGAEGEGWVVDAAEDAAAPADTSTPPQ